MSTFVNRTGVRLPVRPDGIAFDLDGTLLDDACILHDSVIAGIKRMTAAGCVVYLASGRNQTGMLDTRDKLGLNTAIASVNGAVIAYPGQPPMVNVTLGKRARRIILDIEDRYNLYVNWYIGTHVYTRDNGPIRELYTKRVMTVEDAGDRATLEARPLPNKCLCIVDPADQARHIDTFRRELGADCVVTTSNDRYIELVPPGADKGSGLRSLARIRGSLPQRFMAVGDAMNDWPMLREAGLSVCFTHSPKDLQDKTDLVIPPLWDGGIEVLCTDILGV